MFARIPLNQFPEATPPRPPDVYRLHLLFFGSPQLRADHPLPHRLLAHLDVVLVGQIFRRQSRPESLIQIRRQDLNGFVLRPSLRSAGWMASRAARESRPCRRASSARKTSRFTCLTLSPSSSAACFCVISRFFALRNVTSRSLSACVINSCPSRIPQAWGCQGDISTLLKGDFITLPPHWSFAGRVCDTRNDSLGALEAQRCRLCGRISQPERFAARLDRCCSRGAAVILAAVRQAERSWPRLSVPLART